MLPPCVSRVYGLDRYTPTSHRNASAARPTAGIDGARDSHDCAWEKWVGSCRSGTGRASRNSGAFRVRMSRGDFERATASRRVDSLCVVSDYRRQELHWATRAKEALPGDRARLLRCRYAYLRNSPSSRLERPSLKASQGSLCPARPAMLPEAHPTFTLPYSSMETTGFATPSIRKKD